MWSPVAARVKERSEKKSDLNILNHQSMKPKTVERFLHLTAIRTSDPTEINQNKNTNDVCPAANTFKCTCNTYQIRFSVIPDISHPHRM